MNCIYRKLAIAAASALLRFSVIEANPAQAANLLFNRHLRKLEMPYSQGV